MATVLSGFTCSFCGKYSSGATSSGADCAFLNGSFAQRRCAHGLLARFLNYPGRGDPDLGQLHAELGSGDSVGSATTGWIEGEDGGAVQEGYRARAPTTAF